MVMADPLGGPSAHDPTARSDRISASGSGSVSLATASGGDKVLSLVPEDRRHRILVLEPYYGGSHRAVLDGLLDRLDMEFDLLTLPARKWKWRMRGASVTMADRVRQMHAEGTRWTGILTSTFLDLAAFRGLARESVAGVPALVYWHENQLVYPTRVDREWDLHFPFTNITTALAADRCVFNSEWNMREFLGGIPEVLGRFPDHLPQDVPDRIRARSTVLAPPFDPEAFDRCQPKRGERCRIVWPHRWEHDKSPEDFFEAVRVLAAEGLDFEVAVAGQEFRDTKDGFSEAMAGLGDRLVHIGQPDDRHAYARLLTSCDISVSTAINEFFGIAMMESCYAGCEPLVPDRLAYTDLYPPGCRYEGVEQLVACLRSHIVERPEPGIRKDLAARYTFDRLVPEYSRELLGLERLGC